MIRLITHFFITLLIVSVMLFLTIIASEALLLFPLPAIEKLQETFAQNIIAVGGQRRLLLYMYLFQNMWVLWVAPLLGLLITIVFLGRFRKGDTDTYVRRMHDLEQRISGVIEDENTTKESMQVLLDGLEEAFSDREEGFLEIGTDGRVVRLTSGAVSLLKNWNEDVQFEQRKLSELIPHFDDTPLVTALQECLLQQRSWYGEVSIYQDKYWLSARLFPSGNGAFLTLRDVSHNHRTEAFMKTTESLMRQVISSAPYAAAVLDEDWNFLYISKSWQELFSIKDVAIGKNYKDVIKKFPVNFSQIMTQVKCGKIAQQEEELWVKKGQERWLSWQIKPWTNVFGKIGGYIFFVDDITEAKETSQRLNQQLEQENKLAYNDVLTGLPNRQLFYDRLNMALAQGYRQLGKVGLLFLDLDGFKAINDKLGHDAGDLLLKMVAERLQKCVRETDTVARLGGDEFTVILNLKEKSDAEIVAQKIIESVAMPYDLNGKEAHVTTSVGVALYPQDGGTVGDLVRMADTAMYQAKQGGKNQYYFYETKDEKKVKNDEKFTKS